jgi:hypothetical protein
MSPSELSVELIKNVASQVRLSSGMNSSVLVLTQTAHKEGRFEESLPGVEATLQNTYDDDDKESSFLSTADDGSSSQDEETDNIDKYEDFEDTIEAYWRVVSYFARTTSNPTA